MSRYAIRICGDTACPNDARFEHLFFYGCVPRDFKERTGRSATFKQTKADDGRYKWNGGCDAIDTRIVNRESDQLAGNQ